MKTTTALLCLATLACGERAPEPVAEAEPWCEQGPLSIRVTPTSPRLRVLGKDAEIVSYIDHGRIVTGIRLRF